MTFKFRCPHCFRKIGAEEEFKGAQTDCPSCGRSIKVPEARFGAGQNIGGFIIEQWLGNGAMGEVHLAKQAAMDRMVALKVMTHDKLSEEEDQLRFVREIHTLAKLNHPNIVSALSAGEFEGGSFLAMTYVNGITAEDKVNKEGPLPEKEALYCCECVAEALQYAWESGKILHRDVKPANFMIDDSNNVLLMDMGIAKSLDSDNDITMAGMVMGTPYYMSPEQARADSNIDQRSDIYSLGASLYHMVTGIPPYNGQSSMQVMSKKLRVDPQDPQEINPALSAHMCKIIKKLMAIDVEERPADWEETIKLLKDTKKSGKSSKKIHLTKQLESHKSKNREKPTMPFVLVILIILVAVGAFFFFKQ